MKATITILLLSISLIVSSQEINKGDYLLNFSGSISQTNRVFNGVNDKSISMNGSYYKAKMISDKWMVGLAGGIGVFYNNGSIYPNFSAGPVVNYFFKKTEKNNWYLGQDLGVFASDWSNSINYRISIGSYRFISKNIAINGRGGVQYNYSGSTSVTPSFNVGLSVLIDQDNSTEDKEVKINPILDKVFKYTFGFLAGYFIVDRIAL